MTRVSLPFFNMTLICDFMFQAVSYIRQALLVVAISMLCIGSSGATEAPAIYVHQIESRIALPAAVYKDSAPAHNAPALDKAKHFAIKSPAHSPERAKYWLEVAARTDPGSKAILCRWLYTGRWLGYAGTYGSQSGLIDAAQPVDFDGAFRCYEEYQLASVGARVEATYFLGKMYLHGQGITADASRAREMFTATVDLGAQSEWSGFAAIELARIIRHNSRPDLAEAYRLYWRGIRILWGNLGCYPTNDPVATERDDRIGRISVEAGNESYEVANSMPSEEADRAGISQGPPLQMNRDICVY